MPAFCTLLYAMEIPSESNGIGNTQFIDMQRAYHSLSEKQKAYYSTLKAVHNIAHNNGFPMQSKYETNESPAANDAIHPLIRVHPISGNRVIYANPAYTHSIIDG